MRLPDFIFSILFSFVIIGLVCSCKGSEAETGDFVSVREGRFAGPDGAPVYIVGMNFRYGAILASVGEEGDRERLHRELDMLTGPKKHRFEHKPLNPPRLPRRSGVSIFSNQVI